MSYTLRRESFWQPFFIGLLLVGLFWLTRLPGVETFPTFIDEVFHINFGAHVLESGPLAHAEEGRQFTVWWYMAFQAQAAAPIWVARVATLLPAVIGFAAFLGIGKLAAGLGGMIAAGILFLFSPYHLFFDRLALGDPISAACVSLAIYFAFRLSRRVVLRDAVLTGLALFLAVGTKISALPFFCVPVIAALTLRPKHATDRNRWLWCGLALAVGGVLTLAYLGLLFWRGYDPFFYLAPASVIQDGHVATETLLTRIPRNIDVLVELFSYYFGVPGLVLSLAGVGYLLIRRRWFLPLILITALMILWLSQRQASRHLYVPISLLLLISALAFSFFLQSLPRKGRIFLSVIALVGVGVWVVQSWLPFFMRPPLEWPLAPIDEIEYMKAEGGGFGLGEVKAYLDDEPVSRVIGILANCDALKWMSDFAVECPRVNPNGEDIPALEALMEANRAEGVYVVLEEGNYVPASAPGHLLTVIERPFDGPTLSIYDLTP